ncbi:hypothetical protein J6590_101342 [Homalodisca vitripennis]|nr:hypothetical protein J6590_018258 [Homalodisca vitripennis]KAG8328799.1 hypothetical protein J6590_101342 [Homalodisca vitripennis]
MGRCRSHTNRLRHNIIINYRSNTEFDVTVPGRVSREVNEPDPYVLPHRGCYLRAMLEILALRLRVKFWLLFAIPSCLPWNVVASSGAYLQHEEVWCFSLISAGKVK